MRILLIAYDFPPMASPQAIRWYYLSRALAKQGAEVHVLAPNLPHRRGLRNPEGVTLHRCHAGGVHGVLARLRSRAFQGTSAPQPQLQPSKGTLNWKGRLFKALEAIVGTWTYPDARGQWRQPALNELPGLLRQIDPAIVISSHEPPVALEVGIHCADRVCWLADLGDPVLTPYTPRRWRQHAYRLEKTVCRKAASISVTTEATRQLLISRHGIEPDKVFVLTQGYDDTTSIELVRTPPQIKKGRPLQLMYSGRFYPFRDPRALFDAVLTQEDVRLTVIAPEISESLGQLIAESKGKIVYLGEQPHAAVIDLQRQSDVLVNIGNDLDAQTPGKLFEYLGSGKPILHCYSRDDDPTIQLLAELGRGWSCRNTSQAILGLLSALVSTPHEPYWSLSTRSDILESYGWSSIARDLMRRCENLVEVTCN